MATKQAKQAQKDRKRHFAFVMYDDSAKDDWKQRLDDMHIQYLYAYHDQDTNPDGTPKKPHYHVIVMFDAPKSNDQIQAIVDELGAANGQFQTVKSLRGSARYLAHLDNPEKYQYKVESVVAGGGADYASLIAAASDKYVAIKEMMAWIKDNQITSFAELMDYAVVYKPDTWFRSLCDNSSYVIEKYIKSRAWKVQHDYERKLQSQLLALQAEGKSQND